MNRRQLLKALLAGSAAILVGHVPAVTPSPQFVQDPTALNQIELIKAILAKGLEAHDDLIERAIFQGVTCNGVY